MDETRIAADLASGCGAELVGELEALVREHPFRERLWAHLMVALFRAVARPTRSPRTGALERCCTTSWGSNRAANSDASSWPSSSTIRRSKLGQPVAPPHPDPWPDEAFRATIEQWRGRPMRTPGLAPFEGPARAVGCAQAVVAELASRGEEVGAAVHSGECTFVDCDVHGVAVDIARQLAIDADPSEVLVSQTVRDLVVGSRIALQPRARRRFDGVPGQWDVFAIVPER